MSLSQQPSFKLSICTVACLMTLVGCASSSKNWPVTPNPYNVSGSSDTNNVRINTLRAFGDSYTAEDYSQSRGITNWTRELAGMVPTASIENYAIGGAKARSGEDKSFDNQLNSWVQRNSGIQNQDLTVVYFGYNDIGNGDSESAYAQSRADYRAGVNRLVSQGAASNNNRIFVTQIHDWSKAPGNNPYTARDVKDWVDFVGEVANSNPNIIAVDLFTVFNRVTSDPAKFGFINVTDANPFRSGQDYLYHDDVHFGNKGQALIARTYRHYLTRAWNWSHALQAGNAASSQLNQDITRNVLSLENSVPVAHDNFRFVPLLSSNLNKSSQNTAANQSFGLAFDVKTASKNGFDDGRIGLALSSAGQHFDRVNGEKINSSLRSQSTALYWMQPKGSMYYSAQLSNSQHKIQQSGHDELLVRSISNQRGGQTWSLEGAVRYTWSTDVAKFTPWVSLNQQHSSLNAGTDQSLYTTDVQYSKIASNQVLGHVGLDFSSHPIHVLGHTQLTFGGGLTHQQTLKQNSLEVNYKEGIYGDTAFKEVLVNPRINKTQLLLSTQADVRKAFRVSASWSVDPANKQDQTLNVTTLLPF